LMVQLFWARLFSQAKLILAVVNSFLKVILGQFRVGEAVLSTAVVRAELQIWDELYRDNFSRNEISRTFLVFFSSFFAVGQSKAERLEQGLLVQERF
jgi:hypothetical protein